MIEAWGVLRGCVLVCLVGVGALSASAESMLPFAKDMAGDEELPLPLGVSATFYAQHQNYEIDSLSLMPAGLPPMAYAGASLARKTALPPGAMPDIGQLLSTINPKTLDVENDLVEWNVKLDAWLLPFFNAYTMLGIIDGKSQVDLRSTPLAMELEIDYDGIVYGLGCVLVGGVGPVFGAVNAAYTLTDLDSSDSSVEAWVMMPQLGVRSSYGAAWVGGMYQAATEEHSGTISIAPLGQLNYDVDLNEREPWSGLVGAQLKIGKRCEVVLVSGFGKRTSAEVSVGARF